MNRFPDPSDRRRPTDLDRLLADLPPAEAAGLRDAWARATLAAPDYAPDAAAVARAERLLADLAAPPTARPAPDRAARPSARRPSSAWPGVALRWGLAAAAVVLAAVVWLGLPVEHAAPLGDVRAVVLPDGSTVTLGGGSSLRHARRLGGTFSGAREVALEGEAFFEVVEAAAPFVVRTSDAEVRVLGTSFGVRAWPDEASTVVAVRSGRVRLAAPDAPALARVLQAGDAARVAAGQPEPIGASVDEALAWRRGDFVYKDAPLGVVLRDVERRFGVAVTASASLARRRVSVALRAPASAEDVVRDLATALGLRYRPRADGFALENPADDLPPL